MTLQASYGNTILCPILLKILDKKELQRLFLSTMSFFWLVGQSTSALYLDLEILKHTGKFSGLLET